jgi:hypothetical protein
MFIKMILNGADGKEVKFRNKICFMEKDTDCSFLEFSPM